MKQIIIITGMLILTSCTLPQRRRAVLVDIEESKTVDTQANRILRCVDKYRGEGIKKAYELCKDLYTLE